MANQFLEAGLSFDGTIIDGYQRYIVVDDYGDSWQSVLITRDCMTTIMQHNNGAVFLISPTSQSSDHMGTLHDLHLCKLGQAVGYPGKEKMLTPRKTNIEPCNPACEFPGPSDW